MTRALLVAVLATAVALLPARPAPGCAIAPRQGQRVATAGETAVILWDDVAQVEHFTRAAVFSGTSADFGFLVPTPGRPTLADAPGPISGRLEVVTAPKTVVRKKLADPGLSCFGADLRDTRVGAAMPAPVQVVERKRVGDLDAAVLKATDADALRGWLGTNGYVSRPELRSWLGGYVADGWYLTAFKVANDRATPAGTAIGGHLKAVRLSFPAAVPIYPYQEPADAATAGPSGAFAPRLLRLFVLAPFRAEALAGLGRGAPAAGQVRTVWAGPIDRPTFVAAATACGLPAAEVDALAGRAWTLTAFEDTSSPRPTTADLAFRPSPDQSPVERPPTVVYEDIYWPYTAGCVGVTIGGPVLLWLAWKLVRRLLRHLPAAPLD